MEVETLGDAFTHSWRITARPGTVKLFEIADYLATRVVFTYDALDAEIAKCDVVCANCHRIRSQKRLPSPKIYIEKPKPIPRSQLNA